MSTITIKKIVTKVVDWLNEARNSSQPLAIDIDLVNEAVNVKDSLLKNQELQVVPGRDKATIWGYFMMDEGESAFDSVKRTISLTEFFNCSKNTHFTKIGVCIEAFKSRQVFISCILKPEVKSQPQVQPEPRYQGSDSKAKNEKNYPNQGSGENISMRRRNDNFQTYKPMPLSVPIRIEPNKEPEIKIQETFLVNDKDCKIDIDRIEQKIVDLMNKYLETHGKSKLIVHRGAHERLTKLNISRSELCEEITPELMFSVVNFVRRSSLWLLIEDPTKIDDTIARHFFTIPHNANLFIEPMNIIAVSYVCNPKGYGSCIIFCGFDNRSPQPKVWNSDRLEANSKVVIHSNASIDLSSKNKAFLENKIPFLVAEINRFRKTRGLQPVEADDEGLNKAAIQYAKDIGSQQALIVKLKKSHYAHTSFKEVDCLKASVSKTHVADYLSRARLELIQSDKKGIINGEWTKMAVGYYEHKESRCTYFVVLFGK